MTEGQQGPRVGALLAERFQVLEVIGRGGMGIVVRAIDQLTGSEVAVKHVRPDLAEDPDYADRLLREAQLARDVSHHNICRVHEVHRHGDEVLLSMEYVRGETLRRRLDRGPIAPREALSIARQICAGVAAAHQKGVVHRDLKPENVLIEANGRAVVLDFGVARKEGTPRDTVTGIALGTPRYMSPEQQQGKAVGPATDVFALGLVIEELYGNHKPPAWLRSIIRKATDRDPRRRQPDAGALGRQLAHPLMRRRGGGDAVLLHQSGPAGGLVAPFRKPVAPPGEPGPAQGPSDPAVERRPAGHVVA
jgi:serine/threonine protein kinase